MDLDATSGRTTRGYLRQLVRVRWLAICVEAVLLYWAYTALHLRAALEPVAGVLALYALINAATALRLLGIWPCARLRLRPVGERELFAQLLIDVAALTAVLYFTGGTMNPFASWYVLPVLYASAVLPSRQAWILAVLCMFCYTALQFFYVPLPMAGSMDLERIFGYLAQFVVYLLVAALVAWFGVRLSEVRRLHASHVESDTQKEARERYLLKLATLSAGTAHEINTPLSTMMIVLDELRASGDAPPDDWKESIDVLWSQIQICRRSLNAMAQAADVERLAKVESLPARKFIDELVERWRALRPAVPLKLRCAPLDDALMVNSDQTLFQAMLNFLGNAADASPHSVELRAGQKEDLRLAIQILDRGPGIPAALRSRIGNGPVTTKAPGRGSGSGVLIGRAAVERFGGTIEISDRQRGGTMLEVELPLFYARAGNKQRAGGALGGG